MSSETTTGQETQREETPETGAQEAKTQEQARQPEETGMAERRQPRVMRRERELPGAPFYGSPFLTMRRMMDDIERMFEGVGIAPTLPGAGLFGAPSRIRRAAAELWSPTVDVFERDNQLMVRADVPGLEKQDVHLDVTEEGLTIEGERREDREQREAGYYRREASYGSFRRLIPLPEGVDLDTAHATMKNGVLEVSFQLTEARRPRRIEITAAETPEGQESIH